MVPADFSFRPRSLLLALLLTLAQATALLAAPIPLGSTGYALELPGGLVVSRPTAPRILFQATRTDQNASIQVVARPGDASFHTLSKGAYFREMRSAIPGLTLDDEANVTVGGHPTLWVRHLATSGGTRVEVQAVWIPAKPTPMVVHAIHVPAYRRAMKKALLSITRVGGGPAGRREVAVPGTPCFLTPPAGWRVGPGQQGAVLALNAPDGMAAIQVNVTPVQPGQSSVAVRDVLAAAVEQGVLADRSSGFRRLGEHVSTANGIPTRMRRYRGTSPALPGDLLFAFSAASRHVLAFNIVVMSAARVRLDPLAKACIASLRDPGITMVRPPTGRLPATRRPAPHRPAPPTYVPFTEPLAGVRLLLPEGWPQYPKADGRVVLRGPAGTAERAATITILRLDRANPASRDLVTVARGLAAERKADGATVLGQKRTRYGGIPAHVMQSKVGRGAAAVISRHIHLERPGGIVRVLFSAPAEIYPRLKPHVTKAEASFEAVAGKAPAPPPTPTHRPAPTPPPAATVPPVATLPPTTSPPPTGQPGAASIDLDSLLAREVALMERGSRSPLDPGLIEAISALRVRIAKVLVARGEIDRGVDYLTRAVQFGTPDAKRLERLGDLLGLTSAPAAPALARSYYRDALSLDPGRRLCRAKLAAAHLAAGEFQEARRHYEVLVENKGGLPDPGYLQELGLVYLSLGAAGAGERFLVGLAPRGGLRFVITRALLLRALGREQEAQRALGQVAAAPSASPAMRDWVRKLLDTGVTAGKGGVR